MIIYDNEKDIAGLILASQSLSYTAQVEAATESDVPQAVRASIYSDTPDTFDLFYTKSILCTTSMNKNDDTFLPHDVWAARKTPVDKFSNLNHDPNKIVGHITSTWAIDGEGKILADDLTAEQLPSFFHLCNGSVIYRRFSDENLQAQSDELIEKIQAGEMFVSLEAFFSSFDYALVEGSDLVIVPRTSETSFLTKKLRCYGGDGLHDGVKIGRVCKNITFGGVAFTPRPANPDSIIFAKIQKFEKVSNKTGVFNKCMSTLQENTMSDNLLEKQIAELRDQLKATQAANKELNDQLAAANVQKFEAEIASLKDALAKAEKSMDDEKADKKKMEDAKCGLAAELDNLKAEYDKVKAELAKVQETALKAARVAKLVEAGVSREEAEAKAATFVALSDEQFDSVVAIAAAIKATAPTQTEPTETAKAEEASQELEASEEEADIDATAASTDQHAEVLTALASRYETQLVKKENK